MHNISKRKMLPLLKEDPIEWFEDPKALHPSLLINNDEDIHWFYKKSEKSIWVVEEILGELSKDAAGWATLTVNQQFFVKNVLAFFAVSDFYVNETITEQLKPRIKFLPWIRWEDFKMMMENTHNMTYGKLVEAYTTKKERNEILEAVKFNPAIQQKIDWMHKWVGKSNELMHLEMPKRQAIRDLYNAFVSEKMRALEQVGIITADMPIQKQDELINKYIPSNIKELGDELVMNKPSLALVMLINIIMEGVFFSGSFCAIFWFKRNGNKLPGLSMANDLISRDEGLHCMFAIMVYRYKLQYKIPQELVHEIMREAVAIEQSFISRSLPNDMLGMSAKLMSRYIEFVADQQLFNLGYDRIWTQSERDNPFPWMEDQSHGIRMTDFFKATPSAYGHHASGLTEEELKPSFDENF